MKNHLTISPILQEATNAVRKMMMQRGYFVRDIFAVAKDIVDLIAIKEGLLNSERWRIRIIEPSAYGGLSTIQIRDFFSGQAKVHNLKGMMITLGPISSAAEKMIKKQNLDVYDLNWLKENSDFGREN